MGASVTDVVTRDADSDGTRLRAVIDGEYEFVWRSIRRLGVPAGDCDDAVQKVFLVVARHLPDVPAGRERAFLFATALRIASNERRAERRKRSAGSEPLDAMLSPAPSPEEVASTRRLLDALLEPLPLELRSVVVLYELEQMTIEEIGEMLELPPGTVASRIRRARELIEKTSKRLRARKGHQP
jgi:RNA polymerase sigma-70 factor (ECF subfamily)